MAEVDKIRVFLDSNVIFSGIYSDIGPPGAIIRQAAEGRFVTVISRQILDEVVRTIAGKLPDALPFLWELLSNIPIEICEDPDPSRVETWAGIMGEDDAPIAAAAHAAGVDLLVSGDNHFLNVKAAAAKEGLHIVSPADFLAGVGSTGAG